MFCRACENRPARCCRRCEREARGEHLWQVMQADLMRDRPGTDTAHLAWERQAADVQRAYITGAQAIREMPR